MSKYLAALLASIALAGCGGGSDSALSVPAAPAPVPAEPTPAVTFLPLKISHSAVAGTSQALTVIATIARAADFPTGTSVFPVLVDDNGVLLPTSQVTRTGATEFSATIYTVPSLTPATYKGNFTLKLCRDAACAAQFPGAPVLLPYELLITAPALPQITASSNLPLFASVRLGAAATLNALVTVNAEGRTWSAASSAPWLKLTNNTGSGNGSFKVSHDATGMPVGTYNADVTVKSSDGQAATIPAQLVVLETAFQIDGTNVLFNAINGAPIPAKTLKFTLDNEVASTWSATSDAPWLSVDPATGQTPAIATLAVNPGAGNLVAGRYDALLTLSSPVSAARSIKVGLNLIPATLSLSSNSLTLGGSYGRSFTNGSVTMTLNTEQNSWPWTLSALPAWLKTDALSGTVNQTGTKVTFTADVAAAPLGTSTVVLSAGAKVNGDVLKSPLTVTINKDQRKLLAAEAGVSLSSTPGWSRLARTITIRDNFGLDGAWSASADKSWLTVTASGHTVDGAGTLTLSANPASLPQNQVSYATVTIASSVAGVTAPETIKVALWKGPATPTAQVKLPLTYTNLLADAIRPYAYAHSGGTSIDVYNVYTAAKIGTIASLGAAVGDMAVSPNGDLLYVFDTANRNIVVVDLATWTKSATWPLAAAVNREARLLAIRPNGVNAVVTSTGYAYLAPSGETVATPNGPTGELAASADGRRLFASNYLRGYSVDYAEISGGQLMMAGYGSSYGSGTIIAANADGSRVYSANGYQYRCVAYQGSDMTEIGVLPMAEANSYTNNVKVGSDGRIFCGAQANYSGGNDLWVYRPDSSVQTSFKVAGMYRSMLTRQMVVTGDSLMLVALTDDPGIVFVPVGP